MTHSRLRRIAALAGALLLLLLLLPSCGEKTLSQAKSDLVEEKEIALNSDEAGTSTLTPQEEAKIFDEETEGRGLGIEQFWDVLQVPMGWVLDLCDRAAFGNYLVALLLFTLFIKLLMLHSGIKQQKNMVKQASFAPRQRAIQKKYAGRTDKVAQQQMQQELLEAQQEAGISTFGGCLGMFIQFPILICLYTVIRSPLRYLSHLTSNQVGLLYMRAQRLGFEGLDEIALTTFIRGNSEGFSDLIGDKLRLANFKVFGLDFSATPSFKPAQPAQWALLAVPVLVFVSYFLSMRLSRKMSYQPPAADGQPDTATSMKIMDWIMPLMSVYISFSVPALLGVYWIYQSVLGVLQQYILKKIYPFPVFTEEDYKEAERQYLGKRPKKKSGEAALPDPNKPKVRSLHHIDDDDEDIPAAVQALPVSTIYGDEDEPEAPARKPRAPRAPLKGDAPPPRRRGKKAKKERAAASAEAEEPNTSDKPNNSADPGEDTSAPEGAGEGARDSGRNP